MGWNGNTPAPLLPGANGPLRASADYKKAMDFAVSSRRKMADGARWRVVNLVSSNAGGFNDT
jgi:hypothetical protein